MEKNKFKTKIVHISKLKHGDIIIYQNEVKTFHNKYLKNEFTGWTIYGDPMIESNGMIEKFLKNNNDTLIKK